MSTVKSKKLQVGTDATSSNNFTIYQPATPDGTLRIGVGNADSPTEVARFDAIPSYSAKAWVNFNGTGTVAIRASGNVSSITDNGTGDYTVNFTNAMPDANYCVSLGQVGYWNTNTVTTLLIKAGANPNTTIPALKTTTQINVMYSDTASPATYYDCNEANVAIFR